jgi:hypothetical protein
LETINESDAFRLLKTNVGVKNENGKFENEKLVDFLYF